MEFNKKKSQNVASIKSNVAKNASISAQEEKPNEFLLSQKLVPPKHENIAINKNKLSQKFRATT